MTSFSDAEWAVLQQSTDPVVRRLVEEVERLRGIIARNNERARALRDAHLKLQGEVAALRRQADGPKPRDPWDEFGNDILNVLRRPR